MRPWCMAHAYRDRGSIPLTGFGCVSYGDGPINDASLYRLGWCHRSGGKTVRFRIVLQVRFLAQPYRGVEKFGVLV